MSSNLINKTHPDAPGNPFTRSASGDESWASIWTAFFGVWIVFLIKREKYWIMLRHSSQMRIHPHPSIPSKWIAETSFWEPAARTWRPFALKWRPICLHWLLERDPGLESNIFSTALFYPQLTLGQQQGPCYPNQTGQINRVANLLNNIPTTSQISNKGKQHSIGKLHSELKDRIKYEGENAILWNTVSEKLLTKSCIDKKESTRSVSLSLLYGRRDGNDAYIPTMWTRLLSNKHIKALQTFVFTFLYSSGAHGTSSDPEESDG